MYKVIPGLLSFKKFGSSNNLTSNSIVIQQIGIKMQMQLTAAFFAPELLRSRAEDPKAERLLHHSIKEFREVGEIVFFHRPILDEAKLLKMYPGMDDQTQAEVFKYLLNRTVLVAVIKGDNVIRRAELRVGTGRTPSDWQCDSLRHYIHSQFRFEPTAVLANSSWFYRYYIGIPRTREEVDAWMKALLNGLYDKVAIA